MEINIERKFDSNEYLKYNKILLKFKLWKYLKMMTGPFLLLLIFISYYFLSSIAEPSTKDILEQSNLSAEVFSPLITSLFLFLFFFSLLGIRLYNTLFKSMKIRSENKQIEKINLIITDEFISYIDSEKEIKQKWSTFVWFKKFSEFYYISDGGFSSEVYIIPKYHLNETLISELDIFLDSKMKKM